jgi:circadian clock protein KaiB
MSKYILRLYITGNSLNSQRAIANLLKLCKEELSNQYKVEIIDVLEEPQRAEREKILVTPTLIKQLPPPLQRIIGDLSNREKVICGLDLITKHPN